MNLNTQWRAAQQRQDGFTMRELAPQIQRLNAQNRELEHQARALEEQRTRSQQMQGHYSQAPGSSATFAADMHQYGIHVQAPPMQQEPQVDENMRNTIGYRFLAEQVGLQEQYNAREVEEKFEKYFGYLARCKRKFLYIDRKK